MNLLIHIRSNHRLFPVNTNLCHKKGHGITWRSPPPFDGVGLRVTTLPLVIGGAHPWEVVDYFGSHPWTQIMFWFHLAFVFSWSVTAATRKRRILFSWLWVAIAGPTLRRSFESGHQHNEMPRIRANIGVGQRRLALSLSYHAEFHVMWASMDIANFSYPVKWS